MRIGILSSVYVPMDTRIYFKQARSLAPAAHEVVLVVSTGGDIRDLRYVRVSVPESRRARFADTAAKRLTPKEAARVIAKLERRRGSDAQYGKSGQRAMLQRYSWDAEKANLLAVYARSRVAADAPSLDTMPNVVAPVTSLGAAAGDVGGRSGREAEP